MIQFCVAKLKCFSLNTADVFGLFKPKNPEAHRYYLLPGMGKANRRKHAMFLKWAIVVGLIISAIFAAIIYLTQRPGPGLFR